MATLKDEGSVERSSHASMREKIMAPVSQPDRPAHHGKAAYQRFLESIGIEASDDNCEQLLVFTQALTIYNQRTGQYRQAWRKYGALNNLIRAATKLERLVQLFWHGSEGPPLEQLSTDDAHDALNYLAFFLRQAQQGQWRSDA